MKEVGAFEVSIGATRLHPPTVRRDLVIVESPYAGEIEANLTYARAALADCIQRGETPLASHLLYTQPGVLDDHVGSERELGIAMGFELWAYARRVCFYVDRGWSGGMRSALDRAKRLGVTWVERKLGRT